MEKSKNKKYEDLIREIRDAGLKERGGRLVFVSSVLFKYIYTENLSVSIEDSEIITTDKERIYRYTVRVE